MREITDHIVSGDQAVQLEITVMDVPGQGGACHHYNVEWTNKEGEDDDIDILFQNGPIKESGINGITQEALLAIVIDRLRSFQSGPFACDANAVALGQCQSALYNLQARTRERIARGVEGTNQK